MNEDRYKRLFGSQTDPSISFHPKTDQGESDLKDCSFIVMDMDSFTSDLSSILQQTQIPVILLFERDSIAKLIECAKNQENVCHFICADSDRWREKVFLVIRSHIEKDIKDSWLEQTSLTLTTSRQKKEVLTRISRYAARQAGFNEFAETVETVAWEIISNALFNAPREGESQKYARLPRDEVVDLLDSEHVDVQFGVEGSRLALSVTDKFGLLSREAVVQNLYRCSLQGEDQVRTSPGGAGMGFFMVLNLASQLDIRVKKDQTTEIICYINFSKRQRVYEQLGIALNLYFEE